MDAKSDRIKRLLFCYAGSKRRLAPQLARLFPTHSIYVSVFGGTGAEFEYKEPSRREVYNDLDENVYAVFAVLRDERQCEQLVHLLDTSHDCRRLYEECFDKLRDNLSLLDRAYCFLMCGNIGFQGRHPGINKSYASGPSKKQRLKTLLPAVHAWRDRMRAVEVENIDAFDLIDRLDSPKTFFFLDPPYHSATCGQQLYLHEKFDHRRLVRRLQRLEGRAMVCGYPHGLYDVQLLGWRRITFAVLKSFGGTQGPNRSCVDELRRNGKQNQPGLDAHRSVRAAASLKGEIMRSKTIPADAEVLRTYDELREFRDSFFNAELYFLLVIGRQGLSKTWDFESRCKPYKDRGGEKISVAHYIKGNITPVEAYRAAYEHRHKLLVFDDAERLWADSTGRYLLRDLTECKPQKTVHWQTDNKALAAAGIPKVFDTSSRVCLIMNRFAFGDAYEYDAIVDRAQFIYFDPTPLEIHKNAALWFWDQEVFDYIGEHLNVVDPERLSARTFVKAWERKPKGDWKEFLDRRYFKRSGTQWVAALESNPKFTTVAERVDEFVKCTGLKRATYFNFKNSLKADGQLEPLDVPVFALTAKPPVVPDLEAEVKAVAEEERRRAEEQKRSEDQKKDEGEYRNLEDRYFDDENEDDEDNDD